jgi:hypothetical protein
MDPAPDNPTPPPCIWNCGRPADSREDVLAEWIRDYLGAKVSHKKSWQLKDLTPVDSAIPTTKNPRPGPRKSFRLRTNKVVCADCNNRWMSVLQNEAKATLTAMFDGDKVTLNPSLQLTLLRWGTMTAICNHYATELDVDRSRRDYFYRHEAPGPNTEVFAAHIDEPALDTIHGSGGWRDKVGHMPRGHVDLFGIRHAAFVIFQGAMPQAVRSILQAVATEGVTFRLPVDLGRTVEWPITSMTTEAVGQLYEDVLSTVHRLANP